MGRVPQGRRRSRYQGTEHYGLPLDQVIIPPAARKLDTSLRPENDPVVRSMLSPDELAEVSRLREIANQSRSRNHRRHTQTESDKVVANELRAKEQDQINHNIGRRRHRRGTRGEAHLPMNAAEFAKSVRGDVEEVPGPAPVEQGQINVASNMSASQMREFNKQWQEQKADSVQVEQEVLPPMDSPLPVDQVAQEVAPPEDSLLPFEVEQPQEPELEQEAHDSAFEETPQETSPAPESTLKAYVDPDGGGTPAFGMSVGINKRAGVPGGKGSPGRKGRRKGR